MYHTCTLTTEELAFYQHWCDLCCQLHVFLWINNKSNTDDVYCVFHLNSAICDRFFCYNHNVKRCVISIADCHQSNVVPVVTCWTIYNQDMLLLKIYNFFIHVVSVAFIRTVFVLLPLTHACTYACTHATTHKLTPNRANNEDWTNNTNKCSSKARVTKINASSIVSHLNLQKEKT